MPRACGTPRPLRKNHHGPGGDVAIASPAQGVVTAMMTVGAFGNTFWAARLAASLAGFPVEVRRLYVDREQELRHWSLARWWSESAPWTCDVLHVLGWRNLWNLWVAARLRRVPVVFHWLGSDVSSFLRSPRWSRVAGPTPNAPVPTHVTRLPTLLRELHVQRIVRASPQPASQKP